MKKIIITIVTIMFGLPIAIMWLGLILGLVSGISNRIGDHWLACVIVITCSIVLINQFKKDS